MAEQKLINKQGEYGVKLSKTKSLLSLNVYERIVSCNWICFILIFSSMFVVSWMMFASFWYLIAYKHGDLDAKLSNAKISKPCVKGLKSFADAIFFSIDLQSTMGYGRSEIQDECPTAVTLFFVQCLVGIFVQATAVSFLYTKFSSRRSRLRSIQFPLRLKLTKVDREVTECFNLQCIDFSKSYENLSDSSQLKLKKYVRNPRAIVLGHTKSGKLKSKNKDKVKVSGSSDYFLQFEFQSNKELMSVNVHGFLIIKRISGDHNETKLEICSTKTIKLFDDTVDCAAKFKLQTDGYKYMHHVDSRSPLRPFLLSLMKIKPKKTTSTSKVLKPTKLKLAISLENIKDEISNLKIPDLKSPVKQFLTEQRSNNNQSCDDASIDSDASSFDAGRMRNKKLKSNKIHFKRRFHNDEELNLKSQQDDSKTKLQHPFIRNKNLDITESSASSLNERILPANVTVGSETTQLEIIFFVEGMETNTGVLLEAKASYEVEDIIPSF